MSKKTRVLLILAMIFLVVPIVLMGFSRLISAGGGENFLLVLVGLVLEGAAAIVFVGILSEDINVNEL